MCIVCPTLQYKFIVDGEWKYAPDQPAMHDERNIINNVVEVQEYVPDHLDSLVGFEPPPSPPERLGTSTVLAHFPLLSLLAKAVFLHGTCGGLACPISQSVLYLNHDNHLGLEVFL